MKRVYLVSTAALIAACSSEPTQPGGTPTNSPLQPAQDAQAQLRAAAGGRTARGFEDEILRLENRIAGLGGLFMDPQGNIVVYLRDVADTAVAMRELKAAAATIRVDRAFRDRLSAGRVVVRKGRFAFSQLVAWQAAVLGAMRSVPNINGVDADEALNQVRLTLVEGTSRLAADQAIAALGLPDGAVFVDFAKRAYANSTLSDKFRPTGGGIYIGNAASHYCTLGFNVTTVTYHETGYLSASHCADGDAPWLGHTGGTMYQNTTFSGNIYGSVYLNPAFTRTDTECMGDPNCTWADAMFVNTGASDFSKVLAAPTYVGENNSVGSTTLAGWWNLVTRAAFGPYTGLTIDKVGVTTGWTRGVVTETCQARTIGADQFGSYVVLCSDIVMGSAVGSGDSGSPVLIPPGSDPSAYAMGILFAGTVPPGGGVCAQDGCQYLFSNWSSVEGHLPRTFDYNTPPGGTVSISGPTILKSDMTCHWTATTNMDDPQFQWSVTDGSNTYVVGSGADLWYAFTSPPTLWGLTVDVSNYQGQTASQSKVIRVSPLNQGCN